MIREFILFLILFIVIYYLFLFDPRIDYIADDGKKYYWDETAYQSDNTKGWVEITK